MMVANAELQRVGLSGWRTGLANLLGKENRAWWGSRRWLVQGIVWTVIINGLLVLMVFAMPPMVEMAGGPEMDPLATGLDMLLNFGAMLVAGGAILLVQDAILGERQLGVTEWLLSKPVSRPAYVLSKVLAHGLGVLVILVGLPGAIAYGVLSLAVGEPLPLTPYLVGMAGLAVHTLFYLALALMMGVLTANRRVLLGVSLGVLAAGFVLPQFLGMAVGKFVLLTPWSLPGLLKTVVLGLPLPLSIWLPIAVTAVLSAIFVAVTLVRFERLEF
jgi:ABC-2 type transport system permease protein